MTTVLYEKENHLARVTLNREKVLNSFNYPMLRELRDVVETIHLDPDVRVVIFTGAGNKAFSAGADLKERRTLNPTETRRNVKAIRDVFNQVKALPQPTIAAVNGYCFGGGFELMLACDFPIAADEAQMGLTETSWAIIPGAGGTQRLSRIVGEMKAKELILTAKKFTAQEALDMGIVLQVADQADLLPAASELAEAIMQNGPVAVRAAKHAIAEGMNVDIRTGLSIEEKAYEQTLPTADRLEALTAFSEKRSPNFTGK